MTLSRYEAFNAVIELGTLTKAAENLNLTQSAISHIITSLEKEFGFPLLIRDRAGINLTSNGERVLSFMRDILQADKRLQQEVAAINGLEIGTVKVGAFTSISSQWLPDIFKEFKSRHPSIEIKLSEGDYDEVNKWVHNGMVDFGFTVLPVPKSLDFIPLSKDKMVCVLPVEHPLAKQERILFDQLRQEPFIMPKWGGNDDVQRILNENNISPKINYEVAADDTIIVMIQHGLGISILPEMLLQRSSVGVCAVELEKPAYRIIGIGIKSLDTISPAAKKMLECAKAWLIRQGFIDK